MVLPANFCCMFLIKTNSGEHFFFRAPKRDNVSQAMGSKKDLTPQQRGAILLGKENGFSARENARQLGCGKTALSSGSRWLVKRIQNLALAAHLSLTPPSGLSFWNW